MLAMDHINASTRTVVWDNDVAVPIMQDNQILLQNTITKECIFAPLLEEVIKEFPLHSIPQNKDINDVGNVEVECKLWTNSNTLFLINLIKEKDEEFSSGVKKFVWVKTATQCEKTFKKKVTPTLCETKWKALKRTYKTISFNNNTSGQKRQWEYYQVMHEILFHKPEITPPATCSSMTGLHCKEVEESSSSSICANHSDNTSDNATESSFSRKRKNQTTAADRRHQEKMQRTDRFNTLFEQMINKMN